jgi:anti-sigma28 factor (negative regulator of flagellin synthesis)
MSAMSHTPKPESAMTPIIKENRFRSARSGAEGPGDPMMPARLQVIHDLIRSGGYQVPASAIADRMIERMLFCRRPEA